MSDPSPLDAVRRIQRNALSVDEVLGTPATHGTTSTPDSAPVAEAADEALKFWCHAFSRGDRGAFGRRLSWDGLTEQEVKRAFASVLQDPEAAEEALEPWAARLAAVFELVGADHGLPSSGDTTGLGSGSAIPFVGVWQPFLSHARSELCSVAGEYLPSLDPTAVADLETHLLWQLSEVGAPALAANFERFRTATALDGAPGGKTVHPGRELYNAFVQRLMTGGLIELLERYPVLARQLSRLTETWVAGVAELAQRLVSDRDKIAARFNAGTPPGPVARVIAGMSDRHHGGRQVSALHFRSGLQLVYKPRDVTMEAAYNVFLRWLAAEGLEPCPPSLDVLLRPGYGWIERARQQAARTSAEVRTYYRRAGALLCAAWILGGRDLHMENVVATRQGPVLVDVEALIQPPQNSSSAAGPGDPGEEADSFLVTGLLSFSQVGVDGGVHDVGGLCGGGGRPASSRQRDWIDVNTDTMRMISGTGTTPDAENLLLLDGKVEPPEKHVDQLAAGFAHAYRFLIERRERLLDPAGPLTPFATARTRIILRPSNLYARVLLELTTPKLQRSGLASSFAIDSLNHIFRSEQERPRLWPLAAEERQALFGLDVPLFTVPVSSAVLTSRTGEPIHDYLADSGLAAVHTRLRCLDETNLALQLQLLRQALPAESPRPERARGRPGRAASAEQLLSAAEDIAQRLLPALAEDTGAACDLYDGCAGTALFFAALAAVTGRQEWHERAVTTMRPIATALETGDVQCLAPDGSIGMCSGLGGIVYACNLAARLLSDARLADMALAAAELLTEDLISGDAVLDVEGGSAGALLALMTIAGENGGDVWLARAAACGRQLLAASRPAPGAGIGWANSDGIMLAGFAHGASGIACALARLFARTADPALHNAVLQAQAYERTLYSATERNWPVLRITAPGKPPERLYMSAWCHGAPGIALARMCALSSVPDVAARNDLEVALDSTVRSPFSGPDHLCCGNLGRVDVILTLGRSLGRADLVVQARERATAVVRRALAMGVFGVVCRDQHSDSIASGFFQGVAGIGYQLLRLTSPDTLPSVLCFAHPARGGNAS